MASKKDLEIIQQAKREFAKAQKAKDEKGMAAARLKADTARGFQTETKVDAQGRYYQSVKDVLPKSASSLPKTEPKQLTSADFRNATGQIKITPEQQKKNQALALKELRGSQGNVASFVRGAAGGLIDPFGLRKLNKDWQNEEQDMASTQNTFNTQFIKNPRQVAQGLKPVETVKGKSTYEGLGEFAGSMVGVDPVGIGITKGVQKGIQLTNKTANKIPVLVNGVTKYVDAPVPLPKANISAPLPRTVGSVAKNAPVETPLKPQADMPPQGSGVTVQPRTPQKSTEISKEQMFVKNGDLPKAEKEPLKDLGADTNKFNEKRKTSKVYSNTYQNSEMFSQAEKDAMNPRDYEYDPVSEKQSIAQAKQRLEADFKGEVSDLPTKSRFDGTDTDTAMGILEQYKQEARQTGDYSKVNAWSKMIQERGTEGGQMIQAFDKYTRTPEGAVIKAQQTVAKVERDIKKKNPNLVAKADKEAKQVSDAIKKAEEETVQELIQRYTADSAEKLFNKIGRTVTGGKARQVAPLQEAFNDLTNKLYAIAKDALPKTKTARQEVSATDVLKAAIDNKKNYQEVWEKAKAALYEKYADNPEVMATLKQYFEKNAIPNFSTKTLDNAVKQTAKAFDVDLGKIIKSGQKDKAKLAKDIQDYVLYRVGASGEDAKALADEILSQYNFILKAKTESALKQMFPEAYGKTLNKPGKKSDFEKVMELINMGAYDNEAIKNVIRAKNNLPVLDNSDIKAILDNMELSAQQTDPYLKNMYASRAEQIISDKVPADLRTKFRALQRLSLILNPKTLVTRNPLGNTLLGLAENVKDVPAAGIDKLVSLKTGERTTAFAPVEKTKAQLEGFGKGLSEWRKDIQNKVDTSPSRGQFELPHGRVFKGEILNALDTFEKRLLQLGDRPFYQAAYNGRIAELKKLGKTGEAAEIDARLYALDRVFQNDSELSKRAMQIRKEMGVVGDILMPFVQTPANVLDKLIDYSPVGMAKAVSQLGDIGKGTFNQKLFVDRIGRSLTGVGIGILAYAMAQNGILTGKMTRNEDLRNAQQFAGQQGYSFKLGDKYYSYDWAQPIGGIFAAVTDAYNAGAEKDDILEAMAAGTGALVDSVFNMSFLSGVLDAFSGYSPAAGIGSALLGSTSQATPTAGANLAKVIDPVVRETYDPNRFKEQANKLVARTPVASMLLPEKVDITGNTVMQSQGRGIGSRALENFLSPYKLSQENNNPVNNELMRLRSQTGDNSVLLNKTPKGFEKDGNKYTFTSDEYIAYQKTTGQTAYKNIEKLINSPDYRSMDDVEKAKAVKKIHDDAIELARVEYFDKKGLPITNVLSKTQQAKFAEVQATGITDKQFYNIVTTADADGSGRMSKAELARAARKELKSPEQIRAMLLAYYKKD